MILAILQARVTSQRLPQKVLLPILGQPLLALQIDRIRKAKKIDRLILATSEDPTDDPLEQLAKESRVDVFRGNLNDVLDRFYKAACTLSPKIVVRLTGDCPLADPQVIDGVIDFFLKGNYDYASNTVEPTFPDGLDVEVFKFEVLQESWKGASLKSQREHVTPYIYAHPEKYKLGHFKNSKDLSSLRWTVDEPQDFEFIKKIYEGLYEKNRDFGMNDVLEYLEKNPSLRDLNKGFKRNEGFEKSLREDQKK